MPIYEYQCKRCNAHTEVIQKLSDKPLTKCRKCGGRLEKLLSAPAIQFKGSGWYVTDYAGKKGGEDKKGAENKSAESSTSSSTADNKSASKETGTDKKESTPAKKSPASTSGD
jgi:putative FmdB family regulatory protein